MANPRSNASATPRPAPGGPDARSGGRAPMGAALPACGSPAICSGAPAAVAGRVGASEPAATALPRSSPPRNMSTRNPTMINGPHNASTPPRPLDCSCVGSVYAPGCIGPGGRGASIDDPASWVGAADVLATPSEAAVVPDAAASEATATLDAAAAALAAAALGLSAEALVVLDADAAAGLSLFVAAFAVFFAVLPAVAAVFFAVFFCPAFFATFFATFLAALPAAARMPPRMGPKASRSGSRAVSFTILSSVIARSPCRRPDATMPNPHARRPAWTPAPPVRCNPNIIAPARWTLRPPPSLPS